MPPIVWTKQEWNWNQKTKLNVDIPAGMQASDFLVQIRFCRVMQLFCYVVIYSLQRILARCHAFSQNGGRGDAKHLSVWQNGMRSILFTHVTQCGMKSNSWNENWNIFPSGKEGKSVTQWQNIMISKSITYVAKWDERQIFYQYFKTGWEAKQISEMENEMKTNPLSMLQNNLGSYLFTQVTK